MNMNTLTTTRKAASVLLVSALLLALSSCMTVPDPATIPPELSIAELSQKGQQSFDQNNFKAAEVYYQLVIDRYGTDASALISAEFEIAHLRMKKKNWDEARVKLEAIVAKYEQDESSSLPPEFLVLAKNDLARIPEKTATAPIK